MENSTIPTSVPTQPTTVVPKLKKPLNKWALASLLTYAGGMVLIILISLIYTAAIFSSASSEQAPWIIFAIAVVPTTAVMMYMPLVAIFSLALAILGVVKRPAGSGKVLAIVMIVLSVLFVLNLPPFLQYGSSIALSPTVHLLQ